MNTTTIPGGAVVVGVDGSVGANRAIAWAARDASLEGRPLAVVHVTAHERGSPRTVADAVALAHESAPDVDVHGARLLGLPEDVLAELSDRAHLVVLGSRGRGPLLSTLLGSVGVALTARATCPVVICRPDAGDAARTALVVGADGSEESLPVIEFAFRQASLRGMPLNVVHCYTDPGSRRWRRGPRPVDKEALRLLLAESVAGMAERFPEVSLTLRLDNDRVAEVLNRADHPSELIVVGRHPARPHGRGQVGEATDVLERSESPVAVVPEVGAADDAENDHHQREEES